MEGQATVAMVSMTMAANSVVSLYMYVYVRQHCCLWNNFVRTFRPVVLVVSLFSVRL